MAQLTINNRQLWYKKTPKGKENYILLHNAGGDHSFLSPQFDMLSDMGGVIAVDFFGHGRSDMPALNFLNIRSYAKDVIQVCHRLNIESPILIGLNYGGNVALEIFAQERALPGKIIMIDPPILISAAVRKFIQDHVRELGNMSPDVYAEKLVKESFIKVADETKTQALQVFSKTSHVTLKHVYMDLLNWDKVHSLTNLSKLILPTMCIFTDESLCDAQKLKGLNGDIICGKVVGSKYWASIEVSEQVNTMIQRFLALSQ